MKTTPKTNKYKILQLFDIKTRLCVREWIPSLMIANLKQLKKYEKS